MPTKSAVHNISLPLLLFAALWLHTCRQCSCHSINPLESFNTHAVTSLIASSTEIQVNASSFDNGDWVEVTWSGVESPQIDDMVALYAPADADVRLVTPVKFVWAIQSPSHIRTGSGSYRFRLVNMRKSVRFAVLRRGLAAPLVEAFGPPLHPRNYNEPLQLHLALTGVPGQMAVQWTTLNRTHAGVRWRTEGEGYHRSALSEVQTYGRDDMCGQPANGVGWADPGLLHWAVMDNLQPGVRYVYSVGDLEYGFSEEYSFLSPPLASPDASVKFLAIADLGNAEQDGSLEVTEMAASLNTTLSLAAETDFHQLLIHNGDISYARGFQTIWDSYWDQLSPLTSRMPYMAVPGNHERDWPDSGDRFSGRQNVYDSGGECGVAFEKRVRMPLPGKDKWWYSFDFGPIHFVQYSTEHAFHAGSEQHSFIVKDLEGVDRKVTPWLIVGGHRPFVVDSTYGQLPDSDLEVARDLQDAFEEEFMRYGVDMTWHGHHHTYQRSCPLYKGRCVPPNPDGSQRAPIHLVIGHAGAGLSYTVTQQKPDFMEVVLLEHGYMRVHANGSALSLEVLSSSSGRVMDSLHLTKPTSGLL